MMSQFEIPKLLQKREQEKSKEYIERKDVDLRQVDKGISKQEYEEMK
jgi:hypothetical protein